MIAADVDIPVTDPRPIHARAVTCGVGDNTIFTFNRLITLYSKSSFPSYSGRVFSCISSPTAVSWTALISATVNSVASLHHFAAMHRHHATVPNQRAIASAFRTSASLPSPTFGLQVHCLSFKVAAADQPFAGSAAVTFYSAIRRPADAQQVFDEIALPDSVCHAALVVGLSRNSRHSDALSAFARIRVSDSPLDCFSLSAALRAAAEQAALEQCSVLHGQAMSTGMCADVVVGTALISGYGNSGMTRDAVKAFYEITRPNLPAFNSLMFAHAQVGDHASALATMEEVTSPDEYTYLALLTAFSNAGMPEEVRQWLLRMEGAGVAPTLEHHTCLVTAMGRSGRLAEAEEAALAIPYEPDAAVWRALLSFSAFHAAADAATRAGRRLLEIAPDDDTAHVIMAAVLKAAGRKAEAAEVRRAMREKGVRKAGGRSWVEVAGRVHVFLAGEPRHEQRVEICSKLDELTAQIEGMGYTPVADQEVHEMEMGERGGGQHSERLALAYVVGPARAPVGKAVRIVKNLRMCRDCHVAFLFFSMAVGREIVVRDVNRYHRFCKGECSCGGVW